MGELNLNEAYAYAIPEDFEPEDLEARAIVHFRPSSDWKGIGYGFDWMRCGDYKEIIEKAGQDVIFAGGDTPYEEIIGYNYDLRNPNELLWNANNYKGIFRKDYELYKKLEKEYKPLNILKTMSDEEKDEKGNLKCCLYYCSWLSLYPNNTAILSLVIEIEREEEIPEKLEFDYDDTCLKVGWANGEPALTVGRNILPDALVVECIKEFGDDIFLDVYAVDKDNRGKRAGRLYLWANKRLSRNLMGAKKTTVLFVNVRTFPKKDKDNSRVQKAKIVKIIEENKAYFRQALIEMDGIYLDLSVADDPHFQAGGHYHSDQGLVMAYMAHSEYTRGQRTPDITYPGMPDGFIRLNEYLISKLAGHPQLAGKSVHDCVVVFFLDKSPVSKSVDKITAKAKYFGVDGGHVSGTLHVLMSPRDMETTIVTHEIGHALGLEHPFANKIVIGRGNYAQENAKYTFCPMTTHNIMDYSDLPGISPNVIPLYYFWKWQWEYMNRNILGNGKVKPPSKSVK